MREMMRRLLRIAFLLVFVVSTVLLGRHMLDKRTGGETYDNALAIASQSKQPQAQTVSPTLPTEIQSPDPVWVPEPVADDPHMEEMAQINLEALQQVNPEVIGWIRIPDTKVDYPLMQGQDNDFYLGHTWEKEKNYVGSVFMEHRNNPNFGDFNTIIYAHNMNDGSMFGTLSKYYDSAYWKKHPYVYIATASGVLRYEVFAFYKAAVDSPTYGLSFRQVQTKVDFLTHSRDERRYDTGILPEGQDRVLTLSTCTASGTEKRWVLQARLKMIEVQP